MPSKKTAAGRPKRGTPIEIVKVPTKRRSRRSENYNLYIQRVQKKRTPKNTISTPAMRVINSLVFDIFGRLSVQSIQLMRAGNRRTLSVAHMRGAVRMIFPNELSQDAVLNGEKAVDEFNEST